MKCKRGLALLLALALMVSPLSLPGTVAFAQTSDPAVVEEDAAEISQDETPLDPTPAEPDVSPLAEDDADDPGDEDQDPATPAPSPASAPEADEEPKEEPAESPAPSASPETTAAPEESPAPSAEPTAAPEDEATPAPSPVPTATPEKTEEPAETAAPTEAPAESPEPAEEPDEETPAPTEAPEESSEPAEDEEPADEAQNPSYASLLPVEVEVAYLYESSIPAETLANMRVSDILAHAVLEDGSPIDVPADATVAWGLAKSQISSPTKDYRGTYLTTGNFDVIIDREQTVNMKYSSYVLSSSNKEYEKDDYIMMIVVNDGHQLDYGAKRYIINVLQEDDDKISFALYSDGKLNDFIKKTTRSIPGFDIAVERIDLFVDDYDPNASYTLAVSSMLRRNGYYEDMLIKAYRLQDYLQNGVNATNIWDDVLGGDDIVTSNPNSKFAPMAGSEPTADDVICLAYVDAAGQRVLGVQGLTYKVYPSTEMSVGSIYTNENGQLKEIVEESFPKPSSPQSSGTSDWRLSLDPDLSTGMFKSTSIESRSFRLLGGYDSSAEHAFLLQSPGQVKAIFRLPETISDPYPSLEEAAASAENVTERILDPNTGLVSNYDIYHLHMNRIAVYYESGAVEVFRVSCSTTSTVTPIDDVKNTRLSFSINAVLDKNDRRLVTYDSSYYDFDTHTVMPRPADLYKVDATALDSYAYNNYTTFFVWDPSIDLSQLRPEFSASYYNGESYEDADVNRQVDGVSTPQVSKESVVDFSAERPVQYTVSKGDKSQNHFVTFAQKSDTIPYNLYVAGPAPEEGETERHRELYLVNRLSNQHNILLANLGTNDLTHMKVTLEDHNGNIKLDDYWTLNDETLKALGDDDAHQNTNNAFLNNMAMIRILPITESEELLIDGTLTITADNITPVVIKLTGISQEPRILNETLAAGVKYVPYSQVIMTNNPWMDINPQTFSLTPGYSLPEGLSLNEKTGEIYGVPKVAGEFEVSISVSFGMSVFSGSSKRFTIEIADNTNENVYTASDENYSLLNAVGYDQGGYDFVVTDLNQQQVFRSEGVMSEFKGFWFNGEKLEEGTDYTLSEGSTVITINSQTLAGKTVAGQPNTLAAEFREGGVDENPLHRTAQNFRIPNEGEQVVVPASTNNNSSGGGSSGGGSSSSNASSDEDTAGSDAAADAAAAAAAAVPQTANVSIRLVDGSNVGIAGLTVELHSTPRSTVTNANGYAYFANVEFGQHTLIVRNASGQPMASTTFTLAPGTATGYRNGVVVAVPGGGVTVTVRLANGALTFLNAIPRTADDFDPMPWALLAVLALIGLAGTGYWYCKRRRSGN